MSFSSNIPHAKPYEEMKDTPYITNLRDLSQKGYEGFNENYGKVNVFDQDTQRNLNNILNNYYKRAESDFDRNYRDTMNKYQNKNYGQFGTLNATPALYRTDMENLQQQRKLADLAYNKSMYYDNLINSELQRRYNTLNMYNQMLEKGKTPYELDLKNWETRNKNIDREYLNEVNEANAGGGALGMLKGGLSGGLSGAGMGALLGTVAFPGVGTALGALAGGTLGAGVGAGLGGIPQYNTNGAGAFSGSDISQIMGSLGAILGAGNMFGGMSGSTSPWVSSFNANVLPYYGMGGYGSSYGSGIDWGRQGALTSGLSKQGYLTGNGSLWTI